MDGFVVEDEVVEEDGEEPAVLETAGGLQSRFVTGEEVGCEERRVRSEMMTSQRMAKGGRSKSLTSILHRVMLLPGEASAALSHRRPR